MNVFKKCKVLLLPTKEKAENFPILKNVNGRGKELYMPTKGYYYTQDYLKEKKFEAQHLYILSDGEVEVGDWVYHAASNTIFKFDLKDETNTSGYEKVIATTDKSLTICTYDSSDELSTPGKMYLPQPSEAFIKKYIDAYNKGQVIENVMVEYEEGKSYSGNEGLIIKEWLKINFKDNTIAIKKIKDSWTREELLEKFNYDSLRNKFHSQSEMFINKKTAYLIIQWIEESLDF